VKRIGFSAPVIVSLTIVALMIVVLSSLCSAEETSFRRVHVPSPKGKEIKAVLTFSDQNKAIEVHPAKGAVVTIPYGQIDKCDYEYTDALMGDRNHWLKIAYHDQDARRDFVLLMDKHEYLHILDALKAHTGIEAAVLGNAKKR
jgi:hypothetical protein